MSSPHSPHPPHSRHRALASWPFIGLIYLYRLTLGPFLGGHCRFEPSCSRYGIEAYREHGPFRGTWLTARRLARCHPFSGRSGFDPVPEKRPMKRISPDPARK
jgi:putative membrane protein insertion efficiency factor